MVRDTAGLVPMEAWDPRTAALDRRMVGTAEWAHMAAWVDTVDMEAWEVTEEWAVVTADMEWVGEWV